MSYYLHPHEQEEREFADGPRLWDATPGVCCNAFQLGACSHTEGYDYADLEATAPEGLATCDNCGKVEHTPEQLRECIDSVLAPVINDDNYPF